jgi:hypothetical protein
MGKAHPDRERREAVGTMAGLFLWVAIVGDYRRASLFLRVASIGYFAVPTTQGFSRMHSGPLFAGGPHCYIFGQCGVLSGDKDQGCLGAGLDLYCQFASNCFSPAGRVLFTGSGFLPVITFC